MRMQAVCALLYCTKMNRLEATKARKAHAMPQLISGQLTPAGIALRYAAFAALWIIVSSYLLTITVDDRSLYSLIEIAKGLLFVAVTSVLVFMLARRLAV